MSTLGSQSHFLNAVKVTLSETMTEIENPTGAIRQIMSQRTFRLGIAVMPGMNAPGDGRVWCNFKGRGELG
jgi:hypothetical protein